MVNYLEGGKTLTKKGNVINQVFKEIDQEEYIRLNKMSVGELSDAVFENLDKNIIYGYGFYGASLSIEDGRYYVKIRQGNTCD